MHVYLFFALCILMLLQIETAREGKQLFEYLEKHHSFKLEDLDTLYDYAKFQYECGNYSGNVILDFPTSNVTQLIGSFVISKLNN